MDFERTTMTRAELQESLSHAVRYPHGNTHKGRLLISPQAYESPGKETNVLISRFAILDCTGSVHVGPWCNIGARTRIYTHDHVHAGKRPLLEVEEEYGVLWQDKYIGADVWIHDGSFVLYQVTHVPDGFVLGAGSVLTENPRPYEIWAGAPARKVDERQDVDPRLFKETAEKKRFLLKEIP
ncbi:acyltransferase [Thermodesulfobacteriota bacterium]